MARVNRSDLARRLADCALLHGSFTLRSGRTSTWYLDKYRFSTRPEVLGEIAEMIARRLPEGTTLLAGAALGGVPLATAASLASGLPCAFVRDAPRNHGPGCLVEGDVGPEDRLVLLEDVATTGGQVLEAAKALRATGAEILTVLAVVDREEGARAAIEAAGYAFDVLFTRGDLGIEAPEASG